MFRLIRRDLSPHLPYLCGSTESVVDTAFLVYYESIKREL